MSGQGAIGFAVALAQLLAAIRAFRDGAPSSPEGDDEKLLKSTSTFFLTSLVFTVLAGAAAWTLFRLALYRANIQEGVQLPSDMPNSTRRSSLRQVNSKIQSLGLAVLGIYTVTIGLFPGITTSIASADPQSPIASPLLWIPVGFLVFNTFDWIGRALPASPRLMLTNKRALLLASACRALFLVSQACLV